VARADFPEPWRVLLVLPEDSAGRHGIEEQQAFALLADRSRALAQTEALCRLVLLGMLPALAEGDLSAFGEALYDFNARVGEMFAPVQGGTYASPLVSELVAYLRRQGVRGVGQSSWGPTVFALAADAAQAEALASGVGSRFGMAVRTVIARPANRGQMTG
jgi:beta-RFAP synthase